MKFRFLKVILLFYLVISTENIKIIKETKELKMTEEDSNQFFKFLITSSFLFLMSSLRGNLNLEKEEFEYL